MLSIANSEIWKLHPNGFILLWDNDSKHRSDISLNYYIENNIQLLEWPAYSPDLNPIESIWGNIKNNFGSKVYNKIESIKSDIEDYGKSEHQITVQKQLRQWGKELMHAFY